MVVLPAVPRVSQVWVSVRVANIARVVVTVHESRRCAGRRGRRGSVFSAVSTPTWLLLRSKRIVRTPRLQYGSPLERCCGGSRHCGAAAVVAAAASTPAARCCHRCCGQVARAAVAVADAVAAATAAAAAVWSREVTSKPRSVRNRYVACLPPAISGQGR